jgi:hypothetical protein
MRLARLAALSGISALTLIAAASSSCGGLASRLQSHVVAENILLDVGDPFGIAPRRAGLAVNFASITGPLNNPASTPISGAGVTLTVGTSSTPITVTEGDPGVYHVVSGSNGAPVFVYASNQTYSVSMVIPSGEFADTYTTTGTAPPRAQASGIPDFAGSGQTQVVGDPMNITVLPANAYQQGLVIVFDQAGNVLYDNRPKTVQDAIDLALGNFDGHITIPGTVFSQPDTFYGIAVSGLKSVPPSGISTNLEILTKFYIGSASTYVVKTAP